jgi:type III pantothenate kinase
MILALDAGNTNICVGCIDENGCYMTARIATDRGKTEDEYAVILGSILRLNGIAPETLHGCILCSVVPPVNQVLMLAAEMVTGRTPLLVKPGIRTGLSLKIDNPDGLGSDRIADTVAASAYYPGPVIVVDMGTMTTLSIVNKEKEFLGGVICPGIRLSQEALAQNTSQLPSISLEAPSRAIGRNTVECMKSGAIYGTAATVDGLVRGIKKELPDGEEATVVLTGGMSKWIAPYCREKVVVDPDLLLKGLWILYQKNTHKQ